MKNVSLAVWGVPATMLCLAPLDWPYGYYTLLRWVVAGAAVFLVFVKYAERESVSAWVVAFTGLALLFNPLIPVHLSRDIWLPINLAAAAAFAVDAVMVKALLRRLK